MNQLAGPVVHVSSSKSWRGGEQQIVYLAEQLRARGVEQLVVCPPDSELARACRERGLPVATAPRRTSIDLLFARALALAASKRRAEVVHAHDAHAHTAAVLAATLFGLRAPVVVQRRVDFPIGAGPFSRWKYGHRAVRRVVCVSRAVANVVARTIAEPSRLEVVHDGVDPARFSGAPRDGRLRRALRVPEGIPLVGNVAALADHKDYFTFVDAAALLLASGVEARFVAIGDGELRREIEAYVRARGLEGRIVLAGFRPDLPAILPELDVLLFTSKTEGLGSSILDAYLCRVPVVATAAGGIPEIVEDGVTGLLCPVGDAGALAAAVARVLREADLRERHVAGGLRRAAAAGVERMADQMLEIYAVLAAK